MKKTKLHIMMEILQWLFFAAIPIALFIWKCTTIGGLPGGTKFIVGCSSYIILFLLYIFIKKVLIKGYLTKLSNKIATLETQIETETDQTKIPLIEKALSKHTIIQKLFSTVPTLIVMGLVLVIVKALESGLVTVYAVIGLSLVSFILGFICQLIQAATIKSKHATNTENTGE